MNLHEQLSADRLRYQLDHRYHIALDHELNVIAQFSPFRLKKMSSCHTAHPPNTKGSYHHLENVHSSLLLLWLTLEYFRPIWQACQGYKECIYLSYSFVVMLLMAEITLSQNQKISAMQLQSLVPILWVSKVITFSWIQFIFKRKLNIVLYPFEILQQSDAYRDNLIAI